MIKRFSRLVAGALAGIMIATAIPVYPVQAEESYEKIYQEVYAYDLEVQKQLLLEGQEESVNSRVTFAGSSSSVNFGAELVYHLFRQGNCEQSQKVTVLTQDITAGYGNDYEIWVDGRMIIGKDNLLLNGKGITYDVYLGDSSQENEAVAGEETESDNSDLAVDLEMLKQEASSTFDLTFEPGEQVKEIRIRAKEPKQAVGNKEFQFVLCDYGEGLEGGEYVNSVITLVEDRQIEEAVVSLVSGSEEVVDGYVTVMVERTGNTNGYTIYDITAEDGSAVNGEDYVLKSAQLIFSPGVSRQRVHIPLVSSDTEVEKNFTLRAANSQQEITYTTTKLGAAKSFKEVRGQINISMDEFVEGDHTETVDGVVFEWEENESRYKFGFRSVIGGGSQRNASIHTSNKYDFTGVKSVKFSASYGVGTIAGDHLDVYISNDDYALNESMLGDLSSKGARYNISQLTGQGMHQFSVDKDGEYYLYMTAEQHTGTGWIYYYLYNQEFDGEDEGHVALELTPYTIQAVGPSSLGGGNTPAGDVKLTLTSDSSVSGEKVQAYRDESFRISYTQMDEAAKFVGYEVLDNAYKCLTTISTTNPTFTLTSNILASYGDRFTDNTIYVRPVFEYENAKVEIKRQNFEAMGSISLSAEIDEKKGEAIYKDNETVIATVKWNPSFEMRSKLTFTVIENEKYTGDYHFTAFKMVNGSSETSALTNPEYFAALNNSWSITIDHPYYQITPIISNRQAKLLLNVTGATHGDFGKKPKDSTADEYIIDAYDKEYGTNDIVPFTADPEEGYRAKWTYRDVISGEKKTYYGTRFYYQVQVPMLMTDNYVYLEFEPCEGKRTYSVVADVYMQGGNLLHEPEADSEVYSAFSGARVSLEGVDIDSGADGSAGTFTISALPGETHTALVLANHHQYVQEVVIPDGQENSIRQTMKLSYYYAGPRVTHVQYYLNNGVAQNGDTIFLKEQTDSVIIAAEIEEAGKEVTDVIYKIKDSNGMLKSEEDIAERCGSQYILSKQLAMLASEGDQIWIELVKREFKADGSVKSQISYGEVNTGYRIVIADYQESYYIPDTGVDQDTSSVPLFGSMYFLMGVGGIKAPTISASKSGGVYYLSIGVSASTTKLMHSDNKWHNTNTVKAYKDAFSNYLKTFNNLLDGNVDDAKQSLKRNTLSVGLNVSAQIALYTVVDEETKNSRTLVVGAWLTFGINAVFTYNYPFTIEGFPCFVCLTISINAADTVELYFTDPDGYTALENLKDPLNSSYKSDNDFKMDFALGVSLGVGMNGFIDLAGGGTGKISFEWVDWSYGTVKVGLTIDVKADLFVLGLNFNIPAFNMVVVDTNPYKQSTNYLEAGQKNAGVTSAVEEQLMNTSLSAFSMKSLDSYQQKVNEGTNLKLASANQSAEVLISDAYEFTRPKMYEIATDKYMIVATVDSRYVSGAGTGAGSQAVLAYAIYDAATETYDVDGEGHLFHSLEPVSASTGNSINFHPSITRIGTTGKYLISWNSILYTGSAAELELSTLRPVIKAAVYDSTSNSVVAYKSLVTEDENGSLMASSILDMEYDEVNKEVVVLYRALNLEGIDANSSIGDYLTAGSTLLCTSIRLDESNETTFSERVVLETGGKTDNIYNVIKTADLSVVNGQPLIAYQMTRGEQANSLSTAEEGSTNHIYLVSLAHKAGGGYEMNKKKEVTEGISDQYHAYPQLLSCTIGEAPYHILMWRTQKGMATLNTYEYMSDSAYTGIRTATIANEFAGIQGDYQIIQGQDGKIYSIWTQGDGTGTQVMMAALEEISDGCKDESPVCWGTGSKVFETTDNRYLRAMTPMVDSRGKLHLLYRETKLDDGSCNVALATVDLATPQLTVENYSSVPKDCMDEYTDIENLQLYVSNLYPKAGDKLAIMGRVKNSGVRATEDTELALYVDGAATDNKIEIPAMSSGTEQIFTFNYQVPDNYDGTPIEFSVMGANGSKLVQSTACDAALEVTNIKYEQLTYLDEDSDSVSYNVSFGVTNNGNDISEPSTFVLSHVVSGKENGEDALKEVVFGTCEVPAVKPGAMKYVQFQVDIPKQYFGDNIFHLAPIVGTIYYNYNPQDEEHQAIATLFSDYVQANEAPVVETLTMAKSKKIGVGQSMNLKVQVGPVTAKEFAGLTYTSSDSSVASIDENGIMTGKKEGSCTVTATTKNGIQKATQIQVTREAASEDDEVYETTDMSGNQNDGSSAQDKNDKTNSAETGDDSPILPLVIMLVICGAVIAGIAMLKRKNYKDGSLY